MEQRLLMRDMLELKEHNTIEELKKDKKNERCSLSIASPMYSAEKRRNEAGRNRKEIINHQKYIQQMDKTIKNVFY